jgi:hypothetical protein
VPAVPPCLPAPTEADHSRSPAITGWTRPVLLSAGAPFFRRLGGDGLVNAVATRLTARPTPPTWVPVRGVARCREARPAIPNSHRTRREIAGSRTDVSSSLHRQYWAPLSGPVSGELPLSDGCSELADGTGGCIATCFVGGSREFSELGVRGVVGIEPNCCRVGGVEVFDQRFGSEDAAAGCAGLDPGGLVDLIAQRVDFCSGNAVIAFAGRSTRPAASRLATSVVPVVSRS